MTYDVYQDPKLTFLGRTEFFFKSPYGKMWSPKSVIFMEKEGTWPLAPAIRMLLETAEKTWRRTFALHRLNYQNCTSLKVLHRNQDYEPARMSTPPSNPCFHSNRWSVQFLSLAACLRTDRSCETLW